MIAFIAFMVCGFQKGAFRSFLGFVVSLFISFLSMHFASKVAEFTYENFICPYLEETILKSLSYNDVTSFEVLKKIPSFISNFLKSKGITQRELNHIMDNSVCFATHQRICNMLKPDIVRVLRSIIAFCIFTVLSISANIILWCTSKVFRFPIFGKTFRILGGFFGLFKGYVILITCMCCLKVTIPFWDSVPDIFSNESISGSVVFKELYNHNPVYEFLSNI